MPKLLPDLKEKMLTEVQRLLEQGGYNAVTIRSVASGCGVAVGTVYNYFPSKEAMVAELLLEDWRACVSAIEELSCSSGMPEPVAKSIHDQLRDFSKRHEAVFRAQAAAPAFAGSFSQYHALLRGQLAAPLRRFCRSDFAAEFSAEALLTWTVAGKEFQEIWALLSPVLKGEQ